jgi:hypothetical protein
MTGEDKIVVCTSTIHNLNWLENICQSFASLFILHLPSFLPMNRKPFYEASLESNLRCKMQAEVDDVLTSGVSNSNFFTGHTKLMEESEEHIYL